MKENAFESVCEIICLNINGLWQLLPKNFSVDFMAFEKPSIFAQSYKYHEWQTTWFRKLPAHNIENGWVR